MAKSWRKRATKRFWGWMGRIEGVEKPAILAAFGLILFRAWRGRKSDPAVRAARGTGNAFRRMRDRLSRAWHRNPSRDDDDDLSPPSAPLPVTKNEGPRADSPR
jgi:hypothetical protein